MKIVMAFTALILSSMAFSHPDGTYVINGDKAVTVTFKKLQKCPAIAGAMKGSLRTLVFSEVAQAQPYSFVNGYFVEIHKGAKEFYVQTDENCISKETISYEASHDTFDVYTLE